MYGIEYCRECREAAELYAGAPMQWGMWVGEAQVGESFQQDA